jgi:hypothetical protein
MTGFKERAVGMAASGRGRATTDVAAAARDGGLSLVRVDTSNALYSAEDQKIIDLVRFPDAGARRADPGYVGRGW